MNKFINKKLFIFSFLVHIFVILISCWVSTDNKIIKKFLVFGLHSKKPTHAYFKSLKAPPTTSTSKWLSARNIVHPQPKVKKVTAPQKQPAKKQTTINHKSKNIHKAKKILSEQPKKPKEKRAEQKQIKEKPLKEVIQKESLKPLEPIVNEEKELNFNLMGESDPNLAIYQKHIQKEVERLWHPPIGVPKCTECTLIFVINSSGNVELFEFVNHSKVLIYDLSISRVAKNFKFDKTLWNKKFTIDFRQ